MKKIINYSKLYEKYRTESVYSDINLRIAVMNTVMAQSLVQIHRKASGASNIQALQHFL
jgi:hypothetical protein